MTRHCPDEEPSERDQSGSSSADADCSPADGSTESDAGVSQSSDASADPPADGGSRAEANESGAPEDSPGDGTSAMDAAALREQLCGELRAVNDAVSTASTGSDHLVAAIRILETGDGDATKQELRAAEATLQEASETLRAVATRLSDDDSDTGSDDADMTGGDDSDDGSPSRVINTDSESLE